MIKGIVFMILFIAIGVFAYSIVRAINISKKNKKVDLANQKIFMASIEKEHPNITSEIKSDITKEHEGQREYEGVREENEEGALKSFLKD